MGSPQWTWSLFLVIESYFSENEAKWEVLNNLFYASCMTRTILPRRFILFHVSEIFFVNAVFFFLTVVPSPISTIVAGASSSIQNTGRPLATGMIKLCYMDLISIILQPLTSIIESLYSQWIHSWFSFSFLTLTQTEGWWKLLIGKLSTQEFWMMTYKKHVGDGLVNQWLVWLVIVLCSWEIFPRPQNTLFSWCLLVMSPSIQVYKWVHSNLDYPNLDNPDFWII